MEILKFILELFEKYKKSPLALIVIGLACVGGIAIFWSDLVNFDGTSLSRNIICIVLLVILLSCIVSEISRTCSIPIFKDSDNGIVVLIKSDNEKEKRIAHQRIVSEVEERFRDSVYRPKIRVLSDYLVKRIWSNNNDKRCEELYNHEIKMALFIDIKEGKRNNKECYAVDMNIMTFVPKQLQRHVMYNRSEKSYVITTIKDLTIRKDNDLEDFNNASHKLQLSIEYILGTTALFNGHYHYSFIRLFV